MAELALFHCHACLSLAQLVVVVMREIAFSSVALLAGWNFLFAPYIPERFVIAQGEKRVSHSHKGYRIEKVAYIDLR